MPGLQVVVVDLPHLLVLVSDILQLHPGQKVEDLIGGALEKEKAFLDGVGVHKDFLLLGACGHSVNVVVPPPLSDLFSRESRDHLTEP